jgi:hypothetical protein
MTTTIKTVSASRTILYILTPSAASGFGKRTLISDKHLAAQKIEMEAADRDFLRKVGIAIESPSDK